MEPVVAQQWSFFGFLSDTTLCADSLGAMPLMEARSSAEIFSATSTPVNQSISTTFAFDFMPTLSWGVATCIILTISLYCWITYRYNKQIKTSLRALFSFEDTFFIFENLTLDFKHFFRYSRCLMLLCISLIAAMTLYDSSTGGIWDIALISVAILYLVLSIFIQRLAVGFVARFSSSPAALRSTIALSTFNWSVISILFCPLTIALLAIPGLWIVAWYLLAVMAIAHSIRLFIYFKLTGFSTLQWFLYLCTLEALPFTIMGGIISRLNIL